MMARQVSRPMKSASCSGPIGWFAPSRIALSIASTVPTPEPGDTRAEPAGEPEIIEIAEDEDLQWAASVMQIHPMANQNAKLFAVSGGDPAINGLVTYLGLFAGPAEGWRVYRIGDFEEWTVSEEGRRRVVLDARESRMGEDGESDRVTVTPAR